MTTLEAGLDLRRLGVIKGDAELAERIEGHIERRASGRIRDLHVVCSDGMIILMGRSRTYHAKQLAQHALMSETSLPIHANEIDVA